MYRFTGCIDENIALLFEGLFICMLHHRRRNSLTSALLNFHRFSILALHKANSSSYNHAVSFHTLLYEFSPSYGLYFTVKGPYRHIHTKL